MTFQSRRWNTECGFGSSGECNSMTREEGLRVEARVRECDLKSRGECLSLLLRRWWRRKFGLGCKGEHEKGDLRVEVNVSVAWREEVNVSVFWREEVYVSVTWREEVYVGVTWREVNVSVSRRIKLNVSVEKGADASLVSNEMSVAWRAAVSDSGPDGKMTNCEALTINLQTNYNCFD